MFDPELDRGLFMCLAGFFPIELFLC
jgi:hypothetical protein